jgi:hypothetical protein
MSDTLLDTVDVGAEEAEEQLLEELARIRSEDVQDYVQIDQPKRDALNNLVDHLWNQLAPSADEGNLIPIVATWRSWAEPETVETPRDRWPVYR